MSKKGHGPNSKVYVYIKLLTLLSALLLVIFAMRQLRSGSPQMNALFDVETRVSWCPEGTNEVEFVDLQKRFTDEAERQSLCSYLPSVINEDELQGKTFKVVAVARNNKTTLIKLEADAAGQIFKVDGMPFKSEKLKNVISGQAL